MLEQADEQVGDLVTAGLGRPISEEVAGNTSRASRFSPFRAVVLVVLLVAALVAWELTRSSAPTYRTAAVGVGTATQTLDSVATITPVNQAGLDFNTSGTVSAVDVSVGQQVTAGQTLASLDVTSLQADLTSAQASLASDQATLASDEASQSAASSSTTTTATSGASPSTTGASSQSSSVVARPSGSTTAATTTTTTTPTATGPSQPGPQITALQKALVTEQHQEDRDASQATAALNQATTACESNPSPGPGNAHSSGSATTTTTTTTTAPTTCAAALSQASAAQSAVSADITKVDRDESALTAALESSSGSASGSGSGSGAPSGTGSGHPGTSGGSGGSPTTAGVTKTAATTASSSGAGSSGSDKGTASVAAGTGSSTSTTGGSGSEGKRVVTSQQLAVDQAAIDTAQANLVAAQQALDDVNLVSTIAGTVGSVSIAPANTVTAGGSSGNAAIVVIGSGSSYDVTTDVAVADIGQIAVGQQALVTPDATSAVVEGSVSSVGAVATSATSVAYPVTIAIDAGDLGGLSGSQANVSIIVKKSVNVTTVPTSAVHATGSIHYVTVIDDDKPKTVRVNLGTVGDTLTQVTSGVTKGELVSLADLAEPVPSSSTTTTRFGGGFGGLGGFGGAGGFGGGSFAGGGRFAGSGG